MEGCYSISEDESKHYGNLIVKTAFQHNYSRLNDLEWNSIEIETFHMGNCSQICDSMMKCKKLFGNQQEDNFSVLLSAQNIIILGCIIVFAAILIGCGLK